MTETEQVYERPVLLQAPVGWTWSVTAHALEGSWRYSASIKRDGLPLCRIATSASEDETEDETFTRLADMASAWIADYLSRSHTGDTGFADLT